MSVIQIILHPQLLLAASLYAAAAVAGVVLFDRIHERLEHSLLLWQWEHIGMPLLRAALMLLFLLAAYPVLFGVTHAPPLDELLSLDTMRLSYLFNLIFVVSLLLPVIGDRHELVLPLQGIAAGVLLFSWLARATGATVHYWPGWTSIGVMAGLALITHWLAMTLAVHLGGWLNRRCHVTHAGELVSRSLVLFLQYPIIIVFCQGLGKQIA